MTENLMGFLDYDAELSLHNERLHGATGVGPADCVLDIGCGAGQTTRDAARAAVSAPMLERAGQLTDEEELNNVTYVQADAQVHRFSTEPFDVAISRFGTMFFTDPVVAFTNIRRALRPAARLVMMVWQNQDSSMRFAAPSPPTGHCLRLQGVRTRSRSAIRQPSGASLVRPDSTRSALRM